MSTACGQISSFAPAGSGSDKYVLLSPPEYKAKLAAASGKYVLIDVRTPEEYTEGHIEGARNIDFLDPAAFDAAFSKMDKNEPVMLYCRSGSRSRRAAEKLQAMGFRKVYDLAGGYRAWGE